MSNPNHPPGVRRKLSAFGSAIESTDITAQITYRDVQRIKPGLTREKAEAILRTHPGRIGEAMLNAGLLTLITCIEGSVHDQ